MHYVFVTSNAQKEDEVLRAMGIYGKKVQIVASAPESLSSGEMEGLLLQDGVIAVLTERSWLSSDAEGLVIVDELRDMQIVFNFSRLRVLALTASGDVHEKEYNASVQGFIDLDQKLSGEDVFGWDDVFIVSKADKDYHRLKILGMKNAARQIAFSRFVADTLTYESRLDLNFNRQDMAGTVEFEGKAAAFVEGNQLIKAGTQGSFLESMVARVLDGGIFFRSASTRREKNYWLPGLNAGIPLTAKKDEIHEITFFFHDLMHFQIPDLVYVGSFSDVEERDAYILYRMMSEAFTLVFADMYFIDGLVRAGVHYDFSKRRIYPLYRHLRRGPDQVTELRAILRASSLYAVNGDDSGFRELLDCSAEGEAALDAFKEKYGRFFSEDLVWTRRNIEAMEAQSEYVRRWIDIVGPVTIADNGLTTVGKFASDARRRGGTISVETVFDEMFETIIIPGFYYVSRCGPEERVSNAFKRYMLGQMSVFARYDFLCPMNAVSGKLMRKLRGTAVLSSEDIVAMRELYATYVDELRRRDLVSDDDARMYPSIHPLFPPNYVFYDAKVA